MRTVKRARRVLGRTLTALRKQRVPGPSDPNWYRTAVGGLWEEMGRFQMNFLVGSGLSPSSNLLDVGCGSLRGGRHFIRFLDPGHYVGIDHHPYLLEEGRTIIREEGLAQKHPTLVKLDNFEFEQLGRTFDFALAQSVFTHLQLNSIIRCLANIQSVLAPGGRFYATFFEASDRRFELEPRSHPQPDTDPTVSAFDADPYHYSFEIFEWITETMSLDAVYIGDCDHPRGQRMLLFTKA